MSERSTTGKSPSSYLTEPGIPTKVSILRSKLSYKAKQEPDFRFYALYDRVCRQDVLETAYRQSRAKKGKPGVDGVSFEDIEKRDPEGVALIRELREELLSKSYRPLPVRRVLIPKPNGKKRPLGIPCIRDRVVQTAVKLILEPIYEADFKESSYGFRPGRRAPDALDSISIGLKKGKSEVYDADLSSYFDTIDHEKLIEKIRMRVVDRSVLKLIRMWLKCPIEEKDDNGHTRLRKPKMGTPQGGVISPLLANIYLHELDRAFWEDADSPLRFAGARIVRYADDFVVLARYMGPRIRNWIECKLESELGLKINRDKTKVVNLKESGQKLNFLGYSFRWDRDLNGYSHKYLNLFPSKESLVRIRERIRMVLNSGFKVTLKDAIAKVNGIIRGWAAYFSHGYPRKSFRDLNYFILKRFSCFLNHRSQRKCRPNMEGESHYAMLHRLGLIRL